MQRNFILFLMLVLLLGHFVTPNSIGYAQSAATGAIGGTIVDQGGSMVSGATVTVTNTATSATRSAITNGAGLYRLPELEPGTYTVVVTSTGFATYRESQVPVTVGGFTDISPKLTVGNVSQTVDVTDTAPMLHTDSSEISSVIDQTQIDNLPINGRRWSSFALLTPGVVSNSDGFGLLSFRGISYLLNNNTVDGADDNQAYFSEARGRTRAAYSISQAAVQEFQVNTSNYSAEYGRAAGGVINTVTKSGGNHLHGELFFYDRDNNLGGAVNPYTLLTVPNAAGNYVTSPYNPKDWRKQWGFGVGGPLIHDKLFWFYSYDQQKRNFPGTARASDPADTFAPANSSLPANESCNTSTGTLTVNGVAEGTGTGNRPGAPWGGDWESCQLASAIGSSYQAGAAYYLQGLGIMNSFLGTVPRTGDQVINFPKLDWQISERNHLALEYSRFRWDSPAGMETQASNFDGRASFGNDFVKEDFGIARLTTVLNDHMVNNFLFQYGRDLEVETSQDPLPNELPLSNNQFNRPPNVEIGFEYDQQGFNIGKPDDLERRALPDERRLQGMDSVSWSHGKHLTKFGLDYNHISDYINNLFDENGTYEEDYSWEFIGDYLHSVLGIGGANYGASTGGGNYFSFSQGFGNPSALIATDEYAGFLTDDWRITPRLTITAGVRYEYQYIPSSPTPNPSLPQSFGHPDDRNNIGPRVGFVYNLYGDSKTILRGGYGLYYGLVPNANILQTYLESGGPNAQINYSGIFQAPCAPVFPNIYTNPSKLTGCAGASTIAYLSPHLQNPQVHEADLALEQDLGHSMTFSLTYMGSFGRELDSSNDTNVALTGNGTISYVVNNNTTQSGVPGAYVTLPHGGKNAPLSNGFVYTTTLFTGTNRPNPNYGDILEIASNVNSKYNALAVQLNRRYSHGLSILSNFTWAHALDFNPYIGTGVPTFNVFDPTNLGKEYGNSSLDVRHRFVFAGIYEPAIHIVGWKKYLADGWRIAPVVQIQNGLPYTPTVSGGTNEGEFKSINGVGSSADRIDILGRNQVTMPKTANVDLRLGKNFYLPDNRLGSYRLEIFAEAFNLLNHQNITSVSHGAYSISSGSGTTPNTLNFVQNYGTYLNANSNNTYSQRQMQLSARLHF
ncbi:TonB-dependent receptor [Granulicella sp. L60]|uniref:TonB-dependent receptor n=1 Tax=Granulicella sp. L60 TaxID=1641866 RepID=UPI00131C8074|nr:TonB-dependent receptor [Granulicella sp. L60]